MEMQKVAEALSKMFCMEFGGKSDGRYRISRSKLRKLFGRRRIDVESMTVLVEELFEVHDLVIFELEDFFAVMEASVMRNWRPVSGSVLRKCQEGE